jgi:hypothetical protein
MVIQWHTVYGIYSIDEHPLSGERFAIGKKIIESETQHSTEYYTTAC